jgi:hypothetical protein
MVTFGFRTVGKIHSKQVSRKASHMAFGSISNIATG